ncbi:XrtA system polysaccharide deacetylase [Aquicoccus sp. G2-2]|uniref:XrtA system polysaccharide deacetylase n=1 Tax=Aquicoccus sp. G2-2 TaxID=3092120 RepID=UPI002ADF7D08|nr:XrtA system polysaccharide deacetylase [Aquicoccus sp. G2-2]MEA1114605.1 XrtA system polysaccharide deacetylase [Aquicoccus sp. G2-2]
MSIDVEDYYHAHALEQFFTRDKWPTLEHRVVQNTNLILDLLDAQEIKATFFTLGSVARDHPGLIRDIVKRGHELASHGLDHYRASEQTRDVFFEDVTTAKHALEDAGGVEVRGYRAASFSIGAANWWAFDALEEAGYSYSSSISTGHRDGADLSLPDGPFRPGSGRLVEYPITTRRALRRHLPTGGGFFRLLPRSMFHAGLRKLNDRGRPSIFYIHPWEFDPEQPRADVGMRVRFRHNVNIHRVPQKFSDLLASFRWGRLTDVFDHHMVGARSI